ncbi:pleckstrin-like [Lytechinus variegatus]|uniref:pleckstrin-like n=1 Tax=Lytechinus variegatus TaxID=7654 RepID=UPI001BB11AF1|nr:pleckstrin-like [Lytechinus variegatus]
MSTSKMIIKEGFLVKKGHKRTNWRTRWFVLTNDSIAYYKQTSDALPAGVVELRGCSVISPCLQYANKKGFAFMITNQEGHELLMQASTVEEREAWAKAIGAAIVECDRSKETDVELHSPQSKINYHDLVEAMKDPDAGIERGMHKVDETTVYKDCFTGNQMVTWLIDWSFAEGREKGIEIGSKLLTQALLQPMTCGLDNAACRKTFVDEEEALYRFSSLNMSNLKNVLDSSDSSSSDSETEERLPKKGKDELPIKPLKGHGGKIVKQGFLLKRGHVRHTWKARLFVLWDDPAYLQYYRGSKAGDEKPLGEIPLFKCSVGVQEAREKSDVTVKNKNRQNLFSVTTKKGKVYVFEARTPEEREDWMRAIISPLSVGRE